MRTAIGPWRTSSVRRGPKRLIELERGKHFDVFGADCMTVKIVVATLVALAEPLKQEVI